jgi:hypothetical protein
MTDEEWLPVREFPDHYEISSLGRLRRINPYRAHQANKVRKPQIARNGYIVFMLSVCNRFYLRAAHRMVSDAFLGPIPERMQVNHKDGNKWNCVLDNLEIVTNSENRAHSYKTLGVKPNSWKSGSKNPNATLTFDQIQEIRSKAAEKSATHREMSKQYGISVTGIGRIVRMEVRRSS